MMATYPFSASRMARRTAQSAGVLIAALCILLFSGTAYADDREAIRQLNFANQMAATNMHRSAVAYYREFIENYGSHSRAAEARLGLARALEVLGDPEAIAAYQEFLRLHPRAPEAAQARFGLAQALYAAARWSEAIAAFNDFSNRHAGDPLVTNARYYEALSLVKTNRPLDAIPLFESVARTAPMPLKADAAFSAAAAYYQARKVNEASEALAAIPAAHPGTEAAAKAEGLLGDILFRQGQYAEAIRRYRHAIDANLPYSDELSFWKAWAVVRNGDTPTGAAELAAIAGKYPESRRAGEALKQAAMLFEQIGDTVQAIAALEKATSRPLGDTPSAEANYDLGRIAYRSNQLERAATALREVIRSNTVLLGEAEYLLGLIELIGGRFSAADAFLQSAEKREIDDETYNRIQLARLDVFRLSGDAARYNALRRQLESSGSPMLAQIVKGNAEMLEKAGDLDGAVREYQLILERFPRTDEARAARYGLGMIRYHQGRFADAETQFVRFLAAAEGSADPRVDDAWYWIGFSRYQRDRMTEALEAFRKAAEFASEMRVPSLFRAGTAAFNLRRFDEALQYFSDAAALATDDAMANDALFNRAETLRNLGRAEDARTAYLEAWKRGGGEFEQALINAAAVYEDMGRPEEAATAYEEAADKCQSIGRKEEALMKAGAVRRALGGFEQALSIFDKVVALGGPATPEALVKIGEIRLEQGETDAAIPILRRASEDFSGTLHGRRALLQLTILTPSGETTVRLLENLIKTAPDDPASAEARLRLGLIARQKGQIDTAVRLLKAALGGLSDGPSLAEARLRLGEIYVERKQYAQARTQLEYIYRSPLYERSPFRPLAGVNLGTALAGLNQKPEALNVLTETADRYPEVAEKARGIIAEFNLRRTEPR